MDRENTDELRTPEWVKFVLSHIKNQAHSERKV